MPALKRAVHIDFHTMPGIRDFGKAWDAAVFAKTLADAHVLYINAFARCNLGFAYYPSQAGIPYPDMQGDMFGDLLRECRKLGIGVSAYMNVGLDHEQASRHMGWLRLDLEGRVIRGDRTANFFRTLCYNNPEYRAYHFAMLKEVIAYQPDGYFFDCIVTEPCFCHYCLKKMRSRGIDEYDQAANLQFQQDSIMEFCQETADLLPAGSKAIYNGVHYYLAKDLNSHIEIECLPASWGYDYFAQYAAYARKIKDTVLYMTGRFQKSWGDFGGFKSKASLENDYYDALLAGVGVSVGDHMHPAKNLEPAVYQTVAELNSWIKQLEPYTDPATYQADIAVIVDREKDFSSPDWGVLHKSHSGLAIMLGELKQPFDILNEDMDWQSYQLIILADQLNITDGLKEQISAHLARGGKVLASGRAALNQAGDAFALKEWDFCLDGLDTGGSSYFHLKDTSDAKIADMDYASYSKHSLLFKGEKTLAERVQAYFDRHWDGFHAYYYLPPQKADGYAAAALNKAGNICQIGFDVFSSYHEAAPYAHKLLVRQCLEQLLPQPLIKTAGLPSSARLSVTKADTYSLLHVKVTRPEPRGQMDIIEEHDVLPAGGQVWLRGSFCSAQTLPERESLPVSTGADGYTRLELPQITGYQLIQLKGD